MRLWITLTATFLSCNYQNSSFSGDTVLMSPAYAPNYYTLDLNSDAIQNGILSDAEGVIEIFPYILNEHIVFVTIRVGGEGEKIVEIVDLETRLTQKVVTLMNHLVAMPRLSNSGVVAFLGQQLDAQSQVPWSVHTYNVISGVSDEIPLVSIEKRNGEFLNPQFLTISPDGNWVAMVGPAPTSPGDSLSFYVLDTRIRDTYEFRNIGAVLSAPRIADNSLFCYTTDHTSGRVFEISFLTKTCLIIDTYSEPVILADAVPIENTRDVLVFYDISSGGTLVKRIGHDGVVNEQILTNWFTSKLGQANDSTIIVMEIPEDRHNDGGVLTCVYLDLTTLNIRDSIMVPGYSQIFNKVDYFVLNEKSASKP